MNTSVAQDENLTIPAEEANITDGNYQRLKDTFLRSVGSLFGKQKNLPKLFFSVTKKLSKFFSISGALLVVHCDHDDRLKVIASKKMRHSHEGLALTLPPQRSLIYSVFRSGRTYIENYPDNFRGNFIEQKLLLDDEAKSLVICPTIHRGLPNGLICFTSPVPYAFVMFEAGILKDITEKFGAVLNRELRFLNI
ncbi:MAG: hypothetical protein JSV44_12085 [Candidatus Zixiibacteriota bacterium]|nr:MAG: hypothetical protein JSV44_12085 [candidate division Zixibacteria bacterium]